MADTARDIITGALRTLGVLASGEAPSASEATDGLSVLNHLLDSWSTESLMVPNLVREVFSVTANQQMYAMGPGGDWNTVRPVRIVSARVILATSNTVELPVQVMTEAEYDAIALKTMTSTLPVTIYPDNAYPLQNVKVWPIPLDGSAQIVINSAKPLIDEANLSTAISLPPGYLRAMKYNLAVEWAAEFGKQPREDVIALASQSKANIKRANIRPRYLKGDGALGGKVRGFSIFIGSTPSEDDGTVDGGTF